MSDEIYGQIPVFFADKEPVYPGNEKEFEKALLGVDRGGLGGSRHYIPKHYPRRVYRYQPSGHVETNVAENAEHFALLLEQGWSGTPLAPPLPPPKKDVTKAEYEANMRTAKAELQNDDLRKQLNTMQEQMAKLVAHLSEKEPKAPKEPKEPKAH